MLKKKRQLGVWFIQYIYFFFVARACEHFTQRFSCPCISFLLLGCYYYSIWWCMR